MPRRAAGRRKAPPRPEPVQVEGRKSRAPKAATVPAEVVLTPRQRAEQACADVGLPKSFLDSPRRPGGRRRRTVDTSAREKTATEALAPVERSEALARIEPSKLSLVWAGWVGTAVRNTGLARMRDFQDLAVRNDLPPTPEGAFTAACVLVSHGAGQAKLALERWKSQMLACRRPRQHEKGKLGPATPETISRRLSSARSWMKACRLADVIDWTVEIDSPDTTPYGKVDPTPWKKIERSFDTEDPRIRLVAQLLGMMGLRRESIKSLRCRDVRLGELRMKVKLKGGSEVTKPIPPEVAETMRAYEAAVNPREDGPESAYLRNARGKPLSAWGIADISKRLGLGSPHKVRHGAAEEARERDLPPGEIQSFLDHKSMATTQIYLTQVTRQKGVVSHALAKRSK